MLCSLPELLRVGLRRLQLGFGRLERLGRTRRRRRRRRRRRLLAGSGARRASPSASTRGCARRAARRALGRGALGRGALAPTFATRLRLLQLGLEALDRRLSPPGGPLAEECADLEEGGGRRRRLRGRARRAGRAGRRGTLALCSRQAGGGGHAGLVQHPPSVARALGLLEASLALGLLRLGRLRRPLRLVELGLPRLVELRHLGLDRELLDAQGLPQLHRRLLRRARARRVLGERLGGGARLHVGELRRLLALVDLLERRGEARREALVGLERTR